MKNIAFAALLTAAAFAVPAAAEAAASSETITFQMQASSCVKDARAAVIVHSFGDFENMEVLVRGLPPNTDFDLFTIQVPKAPFGVSWYVGDIKTDSFGVGVGNFTGRFSSETFVVSPGAVQPPWIHPGDARIGAQFAPIHTFHLGLWFNSPADAVKAGCPNITTPFNGEHNAGVQVLNTGSYPDLRGPLLQLR